MLLVSRVVNDRKHCLSPQWFLSTSTIFYPHNLVFSGICSIKTQLKEKAPN
jgi:hypothetical protein